MVTIYTQNKFLPEKHYIFNIFFHEFLGIDYTLKFHELCSYKIVLESGRYVEFKDAFFSAFDEEQGYLDKRNLPEKVLSDKNPFRPEKDEIVLFGDESFNQSEDIVKCGNDIFAASFLMLTRWEEYVIIDRDAHQRFPDAQSCAQRLHFHKRPVVDEYAYMLVNIFNFLGVEKRPAKQYQLILTHDIDDIERYSSLYKFFRALTGDLSKRKSLRLFIRTFIDFFQIRMKLKKDPYDQFDFLMNLAEKNNLHAFFYFIPEVKGESDMRYDFFAPKVKQWIHNILKRAHGVGIHGSLKSFNAYSYYKEERDRFREIYENVSHNRQHFLKFSVPDTWQILEEAGMVSDTTIGFVNDWGFRAGTCSSYPVFNILRREILNLTEYPLIVMDTALKRKYGNFKDMYGELKKAYEITKKYNGDLVILWHNSNINHYEWKGAKEFLEKAIKEIRR